MTKKIILATLVVLGSIELSAYTYEVNPLIGKNFTESGALVNDSTAYGIRVNKYVSEDNAIMFGYTRMNNVDYKRKNTTTKRTSSYNNCNVDPCATKICLPNSSTGGSNSTNTSAGTNNNTNTSAGTNSNTNTSTGTNNNTNTSAGTNSNTNTSTGTNSNTNTSTETNSNTNTSSTNVNHIVNLSNSRSSNTDINRFYINGLHNIKTKYSRLVPYVYGGFGYEYIENVLADNDSQGFFNVGGGLKFKVNDRFSLVSDIQSVAKFKSHDFDILGSLGVGYLFGSLLQPEPESLVASGLEDVQPAPIKREITVIKVSPEPISVTPVLADTPTGEYYVQMAAGFKTDMETGCKHTKDLREAGIDYDIKYTTINGKNAALVVVGPFETKEEAKSQLPSLRRYSKNAFVKRIKN